MKRALRSLLVALIAIVSLAALWAPALPGILPEEMRQTYLFYFAIIRAITVAIVGFLIIQLLTSALTVKLKYLGREVYLLRNVIAIIGYIIVSFIILALFEVTGVSVVAGATVSGLVIGLALQPVLSNLFASLFILGTGFLKPGSTIKISGGLPISPVVLPAYKMFSRDEFIPVLRGTIVEVGLMHTRILSEGGELVKVPNNIIFSSSIVMEEKEEPKIVRVRYEFPIQYDPEIVLKKIQVELSKNNFRDYKVYLEEQSDKNNYIVLIVAETPPNIKIREYRSDLLKHIIKVHRELILSSQRSDLTSTFRNKYEFGV
ncbi:MAG: mechanosensitive ion channel family protein [Candidatus Bathyarchaeia archaeon]